MVQWHASFKRRMSCKAYLSICMYSELFSVAVDVVGGPMLMVFIGLR